MAPRDTPPKAIALLNKSVVAALQSPEVAARLRAEGYEPIGNTPKEMASSIMTESATWAQVIKGAGIRAD